MASLAPTSAAARWSARLNLMAALLLLPDRRMLDASSSRTRRRGLRAGEWVEVRSAEEILATLDANQCLDGLPFMPEMLQYCGKRFRVHKSAHKTCDTIESHAIRNMANAVHLDGLRCDGEAHGGCQAACTLYWKESWLKPVPDGNQTSVPAPDARPAQGALAQGIIRLHEVTRQQKSDCESHECFRCQATELLNATTEVRRRDRWNPLFYVKDLTSGNVKPL